MLVSLTVGKVDAGVAVLLTEDKRLIEFPSILLPPDIHSGSIVDINVSRNQHAELIAEQKFTSLQAEIFESFGSRSPSAPVLRCRNATQTSVVLEWDPIDLATSELRSLSLFRNGTKAGVIPRDKLSTKISGLALDTAYTFQLVLRTSAGQYSSEKLSVRTHKMTDLSGITITSGVMPRQLKDSLASTVQRIGAKMIDAVRIDTTHFVCTEPRGQAWEKAVELNVPVVVPDWVMGCEREGRIVGVRGYYLDADPKLRVMGPSTVGGSQQQSPSSTHRPSVASIPPVRESPRIEHTPPTPIEKTREAEPRSATASSIKSSSTPSDSTATATSLPQRSIAQVPSAGREGPASTIAEEDEEEEEEEEEEEAELEEENEKQTESTASPALRSDHPSTRTDADAASTQDDTETNFDEVAL